MADLNPLGVQYNNLKTAPDAGVGRPSLPLSIRSPGTSSSSEQSLEPTVLSPCDFRKEYRINYLLFAE